jgi:hypothetical protein
MAHGPMADDSKIGLGESIESRSEQPVTFIGEKVTSQIVTPLLGMLAELLRAKRPNGSRPVEIGLPMSPWEPGTYLVSYERDFERLWKLIGSQPMITGQDPVDIILDWESVPKNMRTVVSDEVPIHEWLTVYDWVTAFAQVAKRMPLPIRCFVIDRNSSSSAPVLTPKASVVASLLPWVRVYRHHSKNLAELRATGSKLDGNVARLIVRDLDGPQLLADLGIPVPGAAFPTMKDQAGEIDGLRSIWANDMTKAGNRHFISNLVGPLLLAQELRAVNPAGAEELIARLVGAGGAEAMRQLRLLLSTLGVLPTVNNDSISVKSPLRERFVNDDVFDQFASLRFLLIDDHACNGFHDLLAALLFDDVMTPRTTPPMSGLMVTEAAVDGREYCLRSEVGPELLLDWLESVATTASAIDQANLLGSKTDTSPDLTPFDILFLDLRLFKSEGAELDEAERAFLKRLTDICKRCELASRRIEALDRAAESALTAIGKIENSTAGFERLLLLPILLSVIDPSLPIVIFSSTHQRALTDRLAQFPNVITCFAKPLIDGYREHATGQASHIDQLTRATVAALELHERRIVWRRLAKFQLGKPPLIQLTLSQAIGDQLGVPGRKLNEWAYLCNASDGKPDIELPHRNNVVKTLARYYKKYILRREYHDFSSVPFEYIEAICTPPEKLANPSWKPVEAKVQPFGSKGKGEAVRTPLPPELRESPNLQRNHLASALYQCRNRKAHGYGLESSASTTDISDDTSSGNELEDVRAAAILQFLTLLDFVEWVECQDRQPSEERVLPSQNLIDYQLRRKCPKIAESKIVALSPEILISVPTIVGWSDFVLYCMVYAQIRAPYHFQKTTYLAIDRLRRRLWVRRWQLKEQPRLVDGSVLYYWPKLHRALVQLNQSRDNIYVYKEVLQRSSVDNLQGKQTVQLSVLPGLNGPEVVDIKVVVRE